MNITELSPQQLRKAADLKERVDALQEQLNELLGNEVTASGPSEAAQAPKNGSSGKF